MLFKSAGFESIFSFPNDWGMLCLYNGFLVLLKMNWGVFNLLVQKKDKSMYIPLQK